MYRRELQSTVSLHEQDQSNLKSQSRQGKDW